MNQIIEILFLNKYNIFIFVMQYISLSLIFWSMQASLKKNTAEIIKAMSSPRRKNKLKEDQDNPLKTIFLSLAWPVFVAKNLKNELTKK
jgi:hypothetical protein